VQHVGNLYASLLPLTMPATHYKPEVVFEKFSLISFAVTVSLYFGRLGGKRIAEMSVYTGNHNLALRLLFLFWCCYLAASQEPRQTPGSAMCDPVFIEHKCLCSPRIIECNPAKEAIPLSYFPISSRTYEAISQM
jgi:hypothetical protein